MTRDEFLTIDYVDVEPIEIPIIGDDDGRLSMIVDSYCKKYKLAVVPLAATDIPSQVTELNHYDVVYIDSERFAFSREIRKSVLDDYVETITNSLSAGIPFKKSLWQNVTLGTTVYKTLCLSRVEWSMLASLFKLYKPQIVNTSNDILFIVGENYEQ